MNRNYKLSNVTQVYLNDYYNILNTMIKKMSSVQLTNSISVNFIQQMIPHYLAAIEMSKNILKYTTNLEVQGIAINIISDQNQKYLKYASHSV